MAPHAAPPEAVDEFAVVMGTRTAKKDRAEKQVDQYSRRADVGMPTLRLTNSGMHRSSEEQQWDLQEMRSASLLSLRPYP